YILRYTKIRCSARYIFNWPKCLSLLGNYPKKCSLPLVPVKAGTQSRMASKRLWIPAFAGTSGEAALDVPLGFTPTKAGRGGGGSLVGVAARHHGCAGTFSTKALV